MHNKAPVFNHFLKTFLILLILTSVAPAQNPNKSIMDINNITSWIRNDGFHPWVIEKTKYNIFNGTFPKGKGGLIFSSGILWGGLVMDGSEPVVRVGGSTYNSGNKSITRLFRVRPDYKDASLFDDAINFFIVDSEQVTDSMLIQLRSQYEKDWDEWPADKGAPFYDANKDGKYEPDVDIPGVPGASQTIWIDYNDDNSYHFLKSQPIGLEIQETYWAYSNDSLVSNAIYKRVKIIYKGTSASAKNSHIDSMYITQWSDASIGNDLNDYAGSDTSLNLGYTYNAGNEDNIYNKFGLIPPAAGFTFLQAPAYKTGNRNDSAIVDFKWHRGYKYFNTKLLNSFIYFAAGAVWSPPEFSYKGTLEWYNIMRGYLPDPPYPQKYSFCPENNLISTDTNCSSKIMLDGDPVTKTGWIDGSLDGPSPRIIAMSTGPFNLSLNDTAEVVIALAAGIGTDYLNSITVLRNQVRNAKSKYDSFVREMTSDRLKIHRPKSLIEDFTVYKNYPNPFNSTTTIQYFLPEQSYVKIEVYNILGEKIKTLVDGEQIANLYRVKFNAESLPSGIYLCSIVINNIVNTQKLVLLK